MELGTNDAKCFQQLEVLFQTKLGIDSKFIAITLQITKKKKKTQWASA